MPPDATAASGPRPIVEFLKIPENGSAPYLEGQKCRVCGAIFLGERATCSSCGTTGSCEAIRLSNRGELYVFSIVHRSFPGIETPYVSAIVDLEGGGVVKANVVNVEPEPDNISFGMPVKLATFVAGTDDDGTEAVAFGFEPR